jgi:hypothetical protein
MHDLNTINRLNAEKFAKSIATYRAAGRHVLAKYEGSTLVSIETFTDAAEALAAHETAVQGQHGGERNVLFAPIPAFYTAARDQSEDRTIPGEHTLGQYIDRLNGNTEA